MRRQMHYSVLTDSLIRFASGVEKRYRDVVRASAVDQKLFARGKKRRRDGLAQASVDFAG